MKNNILLALSIVLLTGCAGLEMPEMPKNINDNKNAIDEFNKQTYKLVAKDEFLKEYKKLSIPLDEFSFN